MLRRDKSNANSSTTILNEELDHLLANTVRLHKAANSREIIIKSQETIAESLALLKQMEKSGIFRDAAYKKFD